MARPRVAQPTLFADEALGAEDAVRAPGWSCDRRDHVDAQLYRDGLVSGRRQSCRCDLLQRWRVKFRKPGGGEANPTQGQAFFFFGADVLKFASTFRPIGFVYGAINARASEQALDLCGASGE